MVTCSKCHHKRELSQMCRDGVRDGRVIYRTYCKECRSAVYRAKRFGIDIPWKDRLAKIKSRAQRKGIDCNLTVKDLEDIWREQNGRCIYTKERLLLSYGLRNDPQVVSVDRIDPRQGYSASNIVLCTTRANAIKYDMTPEEFKEWMPLWHSRLDKFLRRNND